MYEYCQILGLGFKYTTVLHKDEEMEFFDHFSENKVQNGIRQFYKLQQHAFPFIKMHIQFHNN